MRHLLLFLSAALLVACDEDEAPNEKVVRGLKAYTVSASADSTVRSYPGVIESTDVKAMLSMLNS